MKDIRHTTEERIRILHKAEGGKKLVAALRREMGLRVPKRKTKRKTRGASTGLPTKATHRGHV